MLSTPTAASVPKKNKLVSTAMMPDSVQMELRWAALFYCHNQVFAHDATTANNCKVLIAKKSMVTRLIINWVQWTGLFREQDHSRNCMTSTKVKMEEKEF